MGNENLIQGFYERNKFIKNVKGFTSTLKSLAILVIICLLFKLNSRSMKISEIYKTIFEFGVFK